MKLNMKRMMIQTFYLRRHYTVVTLVITLLVVSLLSQVPALAAAVLLVDGEHGELHIHGHLMAGACQLDMRSEFQLVDMGVISSVLLRRPGDEGTPVTFVLQLRDCQSRGGEQMDYSTGVVSKDWRQPIVSVSFLAPTDPDMAALIMVRGVSGMALKLKDSQGRDVVPGVPGRPQFVTPQQDLLIYTVTPVRTSAPLTYGEFRAVADFRVNYD